MSADEISVGNSAEEVQTLEFRFRPETYCVDVEYVSEIVDRGQPTAVPSAPDYVEGVMDLRGWTMSTINPKSFLSIDAGGELKRIVTFDPNKFGSEAATGWLIDEVYQAVHVLMDDVEDLLLEEDDSIEGVIERDGSLVVWISPVRAIK